MSLADLQSTLTPTTTTKTQAEKDLEDLMSIGSTPQVSTVTQEAVDPGLADLQALEPPPVAAPAPVVKTQAEKDAEVMAQIPSMNFSQLNTLTVFGTPAQQTAARAEINKRNTAAATPAPTSTAPDLADAAPGSTPTPVTPATTSTPAPISTPATTEPVLIGSHPSGAMVWRLPSGEEVPGDANGPYTAQPITREDPLLTLNADLRRAIQLNPEAWPAERFREEDRATVEQVKEQRRIEQEEMDAARVRQEQEDLALAKSYGFSNYVEFEASLNTTIEDFILGQGGSAADVEAATAENEQFSAAGISKPDFVTDSTATGRVKVRVDNLYRRRHVTSR